MSKKSVLGEDPLASLVPVQPTKQPQKEKRTKKLKVKKVRATFHVPQDLLEEARDAVYHLSGPPLRLTLAALVENSLKKELKRIKKAHNEGKNFPKRSEELRGGRPIQI